MSVFFQPSSTRGCKIQRFFESHEILGFSGFHGGKKLRVKKSYGCKKNTRPSKAAENFWPFFWCKIKISVGKFFFDLSGSAIFDISEFHGCKIWSILARLPKTANVLTWSPPRIPMSGHSVIFEKWPFPKWGSFLAGGGGGTYPGPTPTTYPARHLPPPPLTLVHDVNLVSKKKFALKRLKKIASSGKNL